MFKANRIIFVFIAAVPISSSAWASSLQFFGNGVDDIDRVKIQIDDPENTSPGPPADIGGEDFTIEFWARPAAGNSAGGISCGNNYNWIDGNIIIDRDRFNQDRTFGISLGAGRVVFGVQNGSGQVRTICGSTDLRDGSWHHVAVQRRRNDGFLWLYVDGTLEASANGPDGDISYPDDGVPGNFCSGSCDFSDPFIVIGAEKHDASPAYPSYFGHVDEVRLSNALRYTSNFAPSQQAFVADGNTVGLYHFDEGAGDAIFDSSNGGLSPGIRRFGGNPAGPAWVADTPISVGIPGNLQFSSANYSVGEGDDIQTITVTRSGGSDGRVTVDYATSDGSATSGSDYAASLGTLTWPDGDVASKSFSVSIVSDSDIEGDEIVNLELSNATGGASIGTRGTAVLTISDDDNSLFADVQPGYWAFTFIETLAQAGITSGCGGGNYCPTSPVTRAQLAVFLERGMKGSNYAPPAATGGVFLDVGALDFAASFIEQLYADGITAGCGNDNYCPSAVLTRDQMAVFLLRAKYGSGYSPPPATGIFNDAPLSYWAAAWIEQLAAEGITAGCGNGNYCPDAPVTRDQMAVFLVRTFNL